MFKYHDEIAKLDGSTAVREMLVRDATEYLDNLSADAEGDADLLRELALAYVKLGDVQGRLYAANTGNTAGAYDSYIKAVALLEKAAALRPADLGIKDDFLRASDALVVQMARNGNSVEEKQKVVARSAEVLEQMRAANPDDPVRLLQLATIYIRYGDSVGFVGNEARLLTKLEYHQKALNLTQQLFDSNPTDPENIKALARSNQRVGTAYIWLGETAEPDDPEKARSNFALALPFHQRMHELIARLGDSNDPEIRRYHVASMASYSETLGRNGQKTEALKMAGEYLKLAEDLQKLDPANREAAFDIVFANEVLAKIHLSANETGPAISYAKNALFICEGLASRDERNTEARSKIGDLYLTLARIYTSLGDQAQAEIYQRKLEK